MCLWINSLICFFLGGQAGYPQVVLQSQQGFQQQGNLFMLTMYLFREEGPILLNLKSNITAYLPSLNAY